MFKFHVSRCFLSSDSRCTSEGHTSWEARPEQSPRKRGGGGDSTRNSITGGAFGQTWDVPSAVTAVFKYVEEG